MRHFLTINDYTKDEILEILKYALDLKAKHNEGIDTPELKGKILAMIFEKSSTRTRVSFQAGIYQLGGLGIFLSNSDLQLGRGEIIKDSSAVISSMVDMIVIRTHEHTRLEEFAKYSSVNVINGLSQDYHPMQVLADYLTMIENKIFKQDPILNMESEYKDPLVAYIGDGNNMANSWLMLASKLGLRLNIASPKGYKPQDKFVKIALENAKTSGAIINIMEDPKEAVAGANVVTTDSWVSMGQEAEKEERLKAFKGYMVDEDLMKLAHKDSIFLHCLPAYRELEVATNVIDGSKSKIIDEAHNRLHVQKGVMSWLSRHPHKKN
ncbi:ornithine carbamoyltransferase [Helicobacter sp. 11S02629-2]|uniref:ornithine carbamoyltransferase n=1 Tax=Helicobacter sp. 11S02629-2 TaxID=1476195 RepID=UPI000BA64E1C|nr:ornithine carbamoyltransferase [Helicobacter sp. 11S02629-2]PAF45850.1 ornithine carbamoyltransferase [Helicobacter sp. 11S02629-2]